VLGEAKKKFDAMRWCRTHAAISLLNTRIPSHHSVLDALHQWCESPCSGILMSDACALVQPRAFPFIAPFAARSPESSEDRKDGDSVKRPCEGWGALSTWIAWLNTGQTPLRRDCFPKCRFRCLRMRPLGCCCVSADTRSHWLVIVC